ncbi:FAD/NAD(P)-binding protein [Luteimonas sp. A277]
MASPECSRFDVVIIGGGASGALVAARLLDASPAGCRVALVEARPAAAEGVAYSTRRGEHLLNVRASGMSAFDEAPADFVDFLRGLPEHTAEGQADESQADEGQAALAARFMPRMAYARYLKAVLSGRPNQERLSRITDAAVDVAPVDAGFEVELASGGRLQAAAVVLAVGNRPARLPLGAGCRDDDEATIQAWDYPAVAAIPADADVCILGAGLSMVDVVLSLEANGHRGRIVSMSRSGLMPLAHAAPAPPAKIDIDRLLAMDLRARTRTLRALAATEVAQGRPWHGVMDALRPHVQALWTSLDEAGQRRFLRHLVRHWDIHRHRIAPEAAGRLQAATGAGRLQRVAGRLVAVEAGSPLEISWRPRGEDQVRDFKADVLVNALGMDKRIEGGTGLLANLQARGLMRPGPHRMGAATNGDGAVLGANGEPVPGLWTLGVLRIGDLWETIAMPDLRGQAQAVAKAVQKHLHGR